MADGKLTFLRPHDGTGRLVFGDVGDVVVTPPVTIMVDADLPGLGTCGLSVGPALRVDADLLAVKALHLMQARSITSLLVVEGDRPVGIVHIHDCLRAGLQ